MSDKDSTMKMKAALLDRAAKSPTVQVLLPQAEATGIAEIDPMWVWGPDYLLARTGDRCPVWGDEIPYKSVTVLVPAGMLSEAVFSLEYVHGGGSISRQKLMPDGMCALRSDYQCW